MGTPTHITDHADQAVARLLQQYREGVSVPALISALCAPLQELEDVLWDIRLRRAVATAEGAQLDVLGRIVGQPREGRTDPVYRIWILARVRLNKGSGRPEDILQIFAGITQGMTALDLEEQYPAAFVLRVGLSPGVAAQELASLLHLAKAGGVRAIVEAPNDVPANTFTLDIGPGLDVGKLADALPA
jgi:hypothetical protein